MTDTNETLRDLAPRLPPGLLYGGDYNPEQWPEAVWLEDVQLMREAGVNLVSLAIFSWAKLEPAEGCYEFGWLDRIVELLHRNGVSICLATATASPPAWLVRAHPRCLPVDESGVRLSPGSRQHYCPNSIDYRRHGERLIRKLAERYGQHPAVSLWHVNNEIGCHTFECFCDTCAEGFRHWLQRRYSSLADLNESWGTAFWSQSYGEWDEIQPPRKMPTFRNPGQVLDYGRFMSDSLCSLIAGEVAAIRSVVPDAKVTTNGLNFHRPNDYHRWYQEVDVAAWDSYPDPAGGLDEIRAAAFNHDLFRGLKGGRPFLLMEQATTQVNWRATNALKLPGQMRALSLAAVGRGADAVMFFQWRAARAGAEKFHSAMVPHGGPEGSRVFGEVRELGRELKLLSAVCGTRVPAKVAVVVGWENRWALELESKPLVFDYAAIVNNWYGLLWDLKVPVDVISPKYSFDGYDVLVVPALYQLEASVAAALKAFVERGGTLVMTYFSGVVDEREHAWLGGYPGNLRDVLGLTVEEWQPLAPGQTVAVASVDQETLAGAHFCDLARLEGAGALASFAEGFFSGRPAVSRHRYGRGEALYFSTQTDRDWTRGLLGRVLAERGIAPLVEAPIGVEACLRAGGGREYLFVVNHTAEAVCATKKGFAGVDLLTGEQVSDAITLAPFGVVVVKTE